MITVEHLSKYYGDHLAVDDLSFEISEGHVYGFLGPNGAGKSTTMNIMTGCLSATEGKVIINGHDIFDEPLEARRALGYLPEQPPLYLNESPLDYLEFVGQAKGLRGKTLEQEMERAIALTGIEQVVYRRISSLSKGYKQRVGIAQALLGDPQVIILDEPTVGLDPLQIIEIRDLIRSLGESRTVLFSSHILSEVQNICDEILMIRSGKLVAFDTPQNLEKRLSSARELHLTADAPVANVTALLSGFTEPSEVTPDPERVDRSRVTLRSESADRDELCRRVFRLFAAADIPLLEMQSKKADLEELFLELAEDDGKNENQEEEL